jgi:hypothetical protein
MARLTGHLGSIYLNTTTSLMKVADTHNWTMELTVEAAPCPIKGEKAEQYAFGGTTVRITCERYTTSAAFLALQARSAGNSADGANTTVDYELRGVDGDGTNFVVSGSGIVVRGNLSAPHNQLLGDTLEIMGFTMPVVA